MKKTKKQKNQTKTTKKDLKTKRIPRSKSEARRLTEQTGVEVKFKEAPDSTEVSESNKLCKSQELPPLEEYSKNIDVRNGPVSCPSLEGKPTPEKDKSFLSSLQEMFSMFSILNWPANLWKKK